jgi:hypothetical protein
MIWKSEAFRGDDLTRNKDFQNWNFHAPSKVPEKWYNLKNGPKTPLFT